MKYLIMGTGGMGGILGGFLAHAGKDVAFYARGAHLEAMRKDGLLLHTVQHGDIHIPKVAAYGPDDTLPQADVVFVCVKGYSLDDVYARIAAASHAGTVVIPILNGLQASSMLREALPSGVLVAEGCIYASAFVSAPGQITQGMALLRVIFGERADTPIDAALLHAIAADLNESKIEGIVAADVAAKVYQKFICISGFAAVDSYFDVNAGEIQKPGEPRDLYQALVRETVAVAKAMDIPISLTSEEDALKWLDALGAGVTSSMHKDILAKKPCEKQLLIFDVTALAERAGVPVPTYEKIAQHFA